MKRIISFLLTLCLVAALCGTLFVSAEAYTEELYVVQLSELPAQIAAGTAPAVEVSVAEGDASVKEAYWVDADLANKVTAIEDGKVYYLAVELEANDGYTFIEETMIYSGLWDKFAESVKVDGAACTVYFRYALLETAEKVDLTVSGAEVGKNIADLEVTVSGLEAELSVLEIYEATDYELVTEGVFEAGKSYEVCFELMSDGTYEFSYETLVAVNGKQIDDFDTDGASIYVYHYISFKEKIDTVALTVAEPAVGAKPGEVKVPEGVNYTIEYYWMDSQWNELAQTDTFRDGIRYDLYITVYANEGYDFAEDAVVTLNGEEPQFFYLDDTQSSVELENSWSFAASVDKVELPKTPENIEAGSTPAEIESVDAQKYTVEAMWVDIDAGEPVTTFEDGKLYALVYAVLPKEGYEVTADTQVFLDGKEFAGFWQYAYNSGYAIKFYVLGLETVDRVDLTFTEPALGEKPSGITAPENDKYEILLPEWLENETGGIFDDADSIEEFTAGKYIFVSANLAAKDGYAFDENTKFYVNGKEVEPLVYWAMGTEGVVALRYEPLTEKTEDEEGTQTPGGTEGGTETPGDGNEGGTEKPGGSTENPGDTTEEDTQTPGGTTQPPKPSNPATGDEFPMAAVIAVMALALVGMAVVIFGKKLFKK